MMGLTLADVPSLCYPSSEAHFLMCEEQCNALRGWFGRAGSSGAGRAPSSRQSPQFVCDRLSYGLCPGCSEQIPAKSGNITQVSLPCQVEGQVSSHSVAPSCPLSAGTDPNAAISASCRSPNMPAVHPEHDRGCQDLQVAVHRVQILHPLRHLGE